MDEETKLLKRIEGKHTLETFMRQTSLKKKSALNLLSLLRKKGYVRTDGGGKQKRIYTISTRIIQRGEGLFTILNRYAKIPVVPPFTHVAHGSYTVENALTDAITLHDFRILQASIYLFNHVKDWSKLYALAKKKQCEQVIGALYDFARITTKTRKMPDRIRQALLRKHPIKRIEILHHIRTDSSEFHAIEKRWNVALPFSKQDQEEMR
jgi:hypothetical protein